MGITVTPMVTSTLNRHDRKKDTDRPNHLDRVSKEGQTYLEHLTS